jgi:hypothetical protein
MAATHALTLKIFQFFFIDCSSFLLKICLPKFSESNCLCRGTIIFFESVSSDGKQRRTFPSQDTLTWLKTSLCMFTWQYLWEWKNWDIENNSLKRESNKSFNAGEYQYTWPITNCFRQRISVMLWSKISSTLTVPSDECTSLTLTTTIKNIHDQSHHRWRSIDNLKFNEGTTLLSSCPFLFL